jgi:hypothetical protein
MNWLIGFFLVIFIITVSLYNQYNQQNLLKEGFTTELKQIIRPHVRNARINIEDFCTINKDKLYSVVKRFGIL